jgi:hypothetical protein
MEEEIRHFHLALETHLRYPVAIITDVRIDQVTSWVGRGPRIPVPMAPTVLPSNSCNFSVACYICCVTGLGDPDVQSPFQSVSQSQRRRGGAV